MKKILKIIGGLLLLLIVLGVIGAATGGKKTGSDSNTGNNQPVQEAKVQEPTVIKVQELADDFDANQVAAESKWKGKLVQFAATISNITDSGLSFSNIASKQFSMTQIGCKVTDKQQLMALKNGQAVTVKGIVGKQTIGVIDVSDCQVVQ